MEYNLPWPDFLITEVGTRFYICEGSLAREGEAYRENLASDASWNRDRIDEILSGVPKARPQLAKNQNPYKSSWYLEEADSNVIARLKVIFREENLDVSVIYSSGKDLDIIPQQAGKGTALQWLCDKLGCSFKNVIVAGNTGNDTGMFMLDGAAKIVAFNARPELRKAVERHSAVFEATRPVADGIIEGLQYFGLPYFKKKAPTEH